MDSINSLSRVMEILRRQMADGAQRSGAAGKPASAAAPNRASQPPIQVLQRQMADRIRAIDPGDPNRQQKARRAFLESVLLWEFGDTLGRDDRFDDMLEHIQLTFGAAPEIARQLDELIAKLGSEAPAGPAQ
jgi:hypothetical protein